MGVGINYRGVGGNRHFDLNGLPTGEADALFKTPRRHKQLLPENFKKALHPMPTDPIAKENEGKVKLNAFDMRPDTLDKKTMPGSAVTASMSGLCLEGEQENPSVVGTKLYGSHGGKKGYHAFNDFDPPVEGGRVGALGAGGEGADNSIAKAGAPFAYQVASRVVMETDDLGRQILVEYDKDVQNTALGRTHTVTGERRRIVGIIAVRSEGVDILHPFQIKEVDDVKTITNNVFYFDGAEKKITDFKNIPQDGFVYLTATKEAAIEGSDEKPKWSDFSLSTEEVKAPEGGRAFNIKLYEFEKGKVKCDYRTTFLTLGSVEGEAEKFKLHIASEHTATSVAADQPPTASVSGDGTKKNPLQFSFKIPKGVGIASIDVNESSESGGQTSITIILDDKEKTTKTFYVHNGQNGEKGVVDETRLYDLQVNGNTLGKVVDGPGGNIIQKQLAPGSGIEITPNGNVLTISATEGNTTSGFTGPRTILKDVRYESPYLQKKLIQETWKDGVLINSVEGEWETYHTAVEETV